VAARRIARLAKSGGRTPQRVLDAALRAGLDYLEWFQREVAKGQADMLNARKQARKQARRNLARIKTQLARALRKAA
jgi:predicted transcriptional regulator